MSEFQHALVGWYSPCLHTPCTHPGLNLVDQIWRAIIAIRPKATVDAGESRRDADEYTEWGRRLAIVSLSVSLTTDTPERLPSRSVRWQLQLPPGFGNALASHGHSARYQCRLSWRLWPAPFSRQIALRVRLSGPAVQTNGKRLNSNRTAWSPLWRVTETDG